MVEPTRTCLHCGDEATYSMTIQEYDTRQRASAATRVYWCRLCRKDSRYPDPPTPEPPHRMCDIARSV